MAKYKRHGSIRTDWFERAVFGPQGFIDPSVKIPRANKAEQIAKYGVIGTPKRAAGAKAAMAKTGRAAAGTFEKKTAAEEAVAWAGGRTKSGQFTKPGKAAKGLLGKAGSSPVMSGIGLGLLLSYLAGKGGEAFVRGPREERMATAEMETAAEMASPETAYLQAMLPQAQEQERAMLGTLLGRLSSGGVLGPSLAKGEYSIGG